MQSCCEVYFVPRRKRVVKDKLSSLWDEFVNNFIEMAIFILGLVVYMGLMLGAICLTIFIGQQTVWWLGVLAGLIIIPTALSLVGMMWDRVEEW